MTGSGRTRLWIAVDLAVSDAVFADQFAVVCRAWQDDQDDGWLAGAMDVFGWVGSLTASAPVSRRLVVATTPVLNVETLLALNMIQDGAVSAEVREVAAMHGYREPLLATPVRPWAWRRLEGALMVLIWLQFNGPASVLAMRSDPVPQ